MVVDRVRDLAQRHLRPRLGDERWERARRLAGRPPVRPSLTDLATEHGTDKWGKDHRYTPHYERHLKRLRDEPFTLLEVGIGGYSIEGRGGASLRMWRDYFPRAQIVGLDLQDKAFLDGDRITTFQGDQTDEALLQRVLDSVTDLKVIVDDGSHRPEHIRATFAYLFPRMHKRGIYVIEDTQTSYWPEFGGAEDRHDPTTTMALAKDLMDGLNWQEYVDESYRPTYTDKHVRAIHAYHNMVFVQKGRNVEGTARRRILKQRYAQG